MYGRRYAGPGGDRGPNAEGDLDSLGADRPLDRTVQRAGPRAGPPDQAAGGPQAGAIDVRADGNRPHVSLSKNLCSDESARVLAGELEGAAARLEWDRMP